MKRRDFWPTLLALLAMPKALLGLKEKTQVSGRIRGLPEYCGRCREGEGWICEQHPTKPFPHDDCGGPGMPCPSGCNPLSPEKRSPYCCIVGCPKDAEFSIHGSSGHFEDVTEACAEHVGALLGTPMWLEKENEHWLVYPIACDG